MANINDYLDWRGDITLEEKGLNEVDNMILSRFSYLPFSKISLGNDETVGSIMEKFKNFQQEEFNIAGDFPLSQKLLKYVRFRNLRVSDYYSIVDNEVEKQFAAICVHLPNNEIYVSYCGTDNTIVGWKEDFNLSFMTHIPAQLEGVKYLKKVSSKYPEKNFHIGGHSKGGNVAVYSAVFAGDDIQDRIIDVTNHDGPGFDESIIELSEYKRILNKIFTYIPQSSIIGRLLEHKEKYKIVESTEKGIMQHDIYSWQVMGSKIIQSQELTNGSDFINQTLCNWLKNTSREQRKQVIDVIYSLIITTDATTCREFSKSRFKNINEILKQYKTLDEEDKKMISEVVFALVNSAKDSIKTEFNM